MNQNQVNSSISCSVSDCTYHNKQKSACTLSSIRVGCCGPATNDCACTECDSFQMKQGTKP